MLTDLKFDFVRELHAITIPPPLQLGENMKIIAVFLKQYIVQAKGHQ